MYSSFLCKKIIFFKQSTLDRSLWCFSNYNFVLKQFLVCAECFCRFQNFFKDKLPKASLRNVKKRISSKLNIQCDVKSTHICNLYKVFCNVAHHSVTLPECKHWINLDNFIIYIGSLINFEQNFSCYVNLSELGNFFF